MNVLYVYADTPLEWNCSEWNCIIPAKAINKTENHKADTLFINEFVQNTEQSQKLCAQADIIIVERNFFGDTLTMMQFWKTRNKAVAAIFDDAYDKMHPQNLSYNFWTHGELHYKDKDTNKEGVAYMLPKPLEQFKWGLQMVKGIQVPSVHLAKDWSEYNNTYYIHNFLDLEKYEEAKPLYPKSDEEIVIGWCGSMSHYASFVDSGILQGLRRIARKYDNVKVLIGGDKRVFELLEVKNKVFQPYVPKEQWVPLLKSFDIGLCPLAGEYDKRRSWIKALEWMASKVPWIASKYPTYDELHDYGMMTENGYGAWADSIEKMIENYDEYKKLAEGKSYEFAVSQSSDNNIEKYTIPLYEKFIDDPYPVGGDFIANLTFPD